MGYRGETPVLSPRDSWKLPTKWTLPSGGGGEPPTVWRAVRSAFISQNRRECPVGTPFFVLSGGLTAWGKGLPSASRLRAGHVPPAPPACGPTPCPPWAAAGPPPAPSSPCRSGRGNVAAKAAPAARPGQVGRQPLRGAPLRKARPRQAACGGPCFAPPPRRSRRRCSGAARPPKMGALGPSAPPARSAALRPALPARPRLRRRPCRAALPTHSPPGVAAWGPSLGVPPPSRAGAPAAGCCCSPCPCGGAAI